ncbi:hypothetical protein [Myxosarcina sp. GI1]|uniref:hypothetical protein n=1 Tax=Myxosarcina sp. GI1 TaxID=1541065 RepID=UPI0012E09887|nr:hypothetical protein [Myxosarcina sp. GI1]
MVASRIVFHDPLALIVPLGVTAKVVPAAHNNSIPIVTTRYKGNLVINVGIPHTPFCVENLPGGRPLTRSVP